MLKLRDFLRELRKCGCEIEQTKKNRYRIFLGTMILGNIPNFQEILDYNANHIRKAKKEEKERVKR